MPIAPGRVRLKTPFQMTFGNLNGQTIPTIKIYYTIDGEGDYSVMIPREGFTATGAQAAVEADAQQYVDLMDSFR